MTLLTRAGVRETRVKRARNDYENEYIEGFDYKRIRDRESAAIVALEAEHRALTSSTDLGGVLDAKDLVKASDDADPMIKRRVIDFFVTARLLKHRVGKRLSTLRPRTSPRSSSPERRGHCRSAAAAGRVV